MPKSGRGLAHPQLWAELSRQTSVLTPGPTGHWYLLKSALQLFGFGVFFLLFKQSSRTSKDVQCLQKIHLIPKRYLWWSNYFPFLPFKEWRNFYIPNEQLPAGLCRGECRTEADAAVGASRKTWFPLQPNQQSTSWNIRSGQKSLLYFR